MDCARPKTRDPVEWIQTAPELSWPMAEQVREWFLEWEPDLVESIKWNMLCYSGRKLVCGLSACQKHLGITFFRGVELPDPANLFDRVNPTSVILTIRLKSLKDFDRGALRELLREAVELDAAPSMLPPPRAKRPPLPEPPFFSAALKRAPAAAAGFKKLSPTCQREYIVWLNNAKRPETREKRLKETLAAIASGLKWEHRKKARTG